MAGKMRFYSRYGAVLERAKLGFGITAFLSIEIERNRKAETELLREQFRKLPQIIACHIITGDADFVLEIVAADLAAYSKFVLDVLNKLPALKSIRSSISLEAVKASAPLPIVSAAAHKGAPPPAPAPRSRSGDRAPRVSIGMNVYTSAMTALHAAKNKNAGTTASAVAFGVTRFRVPLMSPRHAGPTILPTALTICERPTLRALRRTGTTSLVCGPTLEPRTRLSIRMDGSRPARRSKNEA